VLGHHSGGFLLCQLDEDLLLVDSHAAHERVLFDGLLARGAAGTRRLLVPELLELGRAAAERLDALRLPLAELGVDITLFGEDTVALQAVPRGLAPARVRQVLLGFAEADAELLPAAGGAAESLRYELAAQLACVGSLGPGERLDVEEGQLLLRCLAGSELGFCAPRGRRTVACFGPDEVARWLALER